jgi:hypothetical protein
LGVGKDGQEIESAVLVETARPPAVQALRLPPSDVLGLETFAEVRRKGDPDHEVAASVYVEDWRVAFYARHTGDNESAKRTAFQRVRDSLCRKKPLSVEGERYKQGATEWPL